MSGSRHGWSVFANHVVLITIALYFVAPLTWLMTAAFRASPEVSVAFTHFTLSNFSRLFRGDTALWISNSLFIALVTTAISVTVSFLAAYPFARFEFRGKTPMLFALVISMTLPLSAIMVPTFDVARLLHLRNTLVGVALIVAARLIPLAIWVTKEFINTIPVELEEAAGIDGASRLSTLGRIIFPLAAPGLAVIGLMAFVQGWGDFMVSLILLDHGELSPISLGIFRASIEATSASDASVDYGVMAAISMVYIIPPTIVFLFTHRYLVRGMVLGAVKQ